jgi:protein-S-isoprenylcysteine O-methyltransferase Ste14
MQTELTFRIILLLLLTAFIAHRGYYTRKHSRSNDDTLKKREEPSASKIAGVLGLAGLLGSAVFIIRPAWLTWASIPLSLPFRWAGVGAALGGFVLLQWAQHALGSNWSDAPRMMKSQVLVTSGPYRWIRHPIYTAFLLILSATGLITANWLIACSFIGMTGLEIASRIKYEESLMIEYYGAEYLHYMKRTGKILPKVG